ncbi:hypothetical protein J5N97_027432 [Dioscorea zingiberensis]|uniref:Endoglucanase n=1 Tax=Dioscorea zingiberensis TaxID=325984 RepID=A0A9D5C4U4_9LILI|nr:hypothetical protein J5N97_027432 [Dioscorea zingiberensis]
MLEKTTAFHRHGPSNPRSHLVLQVMAAMLQLRCFGPTLSPSLRFAGWTTDSVLAVLAAIPSFFFLSSRSIGRQPTTRHRSPLKPRSLAAHRDSSKVHLGVSQALGFYTWVESHCGFIHNESTCRAMSRVLARANSLQNLWRFLRSNETLVSTATVTSIIKVLGDEGLAREALAAFYRMKQLHCKPDVVAYNTVISALCRVGDFKNARSLLEQMELPGARCPPDTCTYTILIGYYCERSMETGCRKAIRRRIWEANHMFRRMLFRGFVPDVVTYNCLINGLCKTYRIERAHEVFEEMQQIGCVPNRITYNSFIRYYSVVNEVDKAVEMMRAMVARKHGVTTSSSYTPIIHALCEAGRVKEASDFVVEMVDHGSIPREYTYKLVCDALNSSGEEGFESDLRRRIEDGIDARFRLVSQKAKKAVGASASVVQVLLSRLRLFLSPGYPYEEILRTFHNQTGNFMCSYLPMFKSFNRTKGGLIQSNHGRPQPLQYVVNAAFLASVFSDYLDAADTTGWYCGPNFYSTDIDYILGNNPQKMSYLVGYGTRYPKRVHHRGASIPKNGVRYNCKGGWKWRDTKKPNQNTIVGAMVVGPDKHDGFHDVHTNYYNYTEPMLAGNAVLVAALVSLSGGKTGIDKNTIFSAVPPLFPTPPPPPAAWKP